MSQAGVLILAIGLVCGWLLCLCSSGVRGDFELDRSIKCGHNEVWDRQRCADRICNVPDKSCHWREMGACFCKPGTIRLRGPRSECIPKEECIRCGPGEMLTRAHPSCDPACAKSKSCIFMLAEPNCQCGPGYFRHPESGDCVEESACPNEDEMRLRSNK